MFHIRAECETLACDRWKAVSKPLSSFCMVMSNFIGLEDEMVQGQAKLSKSPYRD